MLGFLASIPSGMRQHAREAGYEDKLFMCNCKHNVNIDHCRICTTRSVFDDHSPSLDEMSEVWERGTSTLLDLLLIARGLSDGGASRGVTPRLVIECMKRLTKDFGWAGAA